MSNKHKDGEKISIKNLLGNQIRRIENDSLANFVQQLIENIKKKNIDWLLVDEIESTKSKVQNQKLIIKK